MRLTLNIITSHSSSLGILVAAFLVSGLAMAMIPKASEFPYTSKPTTRPAAPVPENSIGKVVLVELATPDIGKAKKFYRKLFGWEFQDVDRNYTQVLIGNRPIAGMIVVDDPKAQAEWISLFAVGNVDATNIAAPRLGARIFPASHDVPGRGRATFMADPHGAIFGILATKKSDFDEKPRAVGEWIWRSLITDDARGNAVFYQRLFNIGLFDLSATDGRRHLVLASDDYAIASINTITDVKPNFQAFWLNYVRVEDINKTVKKLEKLHGRVIVKVQKDDNDDKVAIVEDPNGARFGLLEVPDKKINEAGN